MGLLDKGIFIGAKGITVYWMDLFHLDSPESFHYSLSGYRLNPQGDEDIFLNGEMVSFDLTEQLFSIEGINVFFPEIVKPIEMATREAHYVQEVKEMIDCLDKESEKKIAIWWEQQKMRGLLS